MKKAYTLVVPVWGEEYFNTWLKYSLPSYLSENNLPSLSQKSDFTLLICTDKQTWDSSEKNEYLLNIKKIYNVLFLDISFLISKYRMSYGHILTYAYHEAIKEHNTSNRYFIFLNADFILADGVFKTIDQLVVRGAEVIFCPSFRVLQEQFLLQLRSQIKPYRGLNTLSMDSRKMVGLAFKHVHPTVIAQTINVNDDGSLITNQMYWKVGKNILLGRHFLVFPFVVQPRTIPKAPTGYIDYNMVYDFHSKGKITYITDSDDAFIVEPESPYKESQHIASFEKSPEVYHEMISKWANALHFKNFEKLFVFHKEDLEKSFLLLKQEKIKFNKFCQQVSHNLKKYKPFLNHPYWCIKSKKLFFYNFLCTYVKKTIKKRIENLSLIDSENTMFFSSRKKDGLNLSNNVLGFKILDLSLEFCLSSTILYVEMENILNFNSMQALPVERLKKIYLFSTNKLCDNVCENYIKNNGRKIAAVTENKKHKILVASIILINCKNTNVLLRVVKIFFIKLYLRFFDPFPHFKIFELI